MMGRILSTVTTQRAEPPDLSHKYIDPTQLYGAKLR
jgi:hypothetical protein